MAEKKKSSVTKNADGTRSYALQKIDGNQALAVGLFNPGGEESGQSPDLTGFEQAGLPPIIKIKSMPPGAWLIGRILQFVPSSQKSIKNPLMYLEVSKTNGEKTEIAFPCTRVIEMAITRKYGITAEGDELVAALNDRHVGNDIRLEYKGEAENKKKGQHAANLFDVKIRDNNAKRFNQEQEQPKKGGK